jgi:serine phosphatase RsbU (regulator of sigma subunit)
MFIGILRDVSEQAAAERLRREHAQALQRYHDELEAEKALAAGILNRLLLRQGLADPRVHHWLAPAADFSGDVVAAARGPDGRLYAMLADATGHGLAAAISVLPVLTTFYGLVERSTSLADVASEMNRRLLAFMPTGRFVAASLVCVDPQTRVAELWVGGMPSLLLVDADGTVHDHIASSHLPLGIVEFDSDMAAVQRIACAPGSQLVLYSDGLPEAADGGGIAFGTDRLLRALVGAAPEDRLDAVKAALAAHTGARSAQDDVSMLLIDC